MTHLTGVNFKQASYGAFKVQMILSLLRQKGGMKNLG